MDTYKIEHPYLGEGSFLEVQITSENLFYAEIGKSHYGVQINGNNNKDEILLKCKQVADLIREIDQLVKQE